MRHVFYRYVDGVKTEITGIKSTHYHQQMNKEGVLKFGNAIAASLEVEYYIDEQTDLAVGDAIWYYQEFDRSLIDFSVLETPNTIFVGFFWVDDFYKNKNVARFVAYDAIKDLDVDYSPRLLQLKDSFPMTVEQLLDDISSFVGISMPGGGTTGVLNSNVNYFYVDGITARTIASAIYELLGVNIFGSWSVETTPQKSISSAPYSGGAGSYLQLRRGASNYIIVPTDKEEYFVNGIKKIAVVYKEGGLNVSGAIDDGITRVDAVKLNGETLGSFRSSASDANVFYITNNIIVENIDAFADEYALSGVWGALNDLRATAGLGGSLPAVKAEIFPFMCPFVARGITYVVNTDGTIMQLPIMNLDWTDSSVLIESYGVAGRNYDDYDWSNVGEQSAAISSVLNNLASAVSQNTTDISDLSDSVSGLSNDLSGVSSDLSDLSAIVGDGSLDSGFTATDLTGAVNELEQGKVSVSDLPLPVASGGTGADNAADALTNLGLGNLGGVTAYGPDAVSVPSGTATEVGSYTFDPGTYLFVGAARFQSNATGYRRLQFFAGTNTSAAIAEDVNTMAVNGMYTFLQITCVRKFTVSTPMRLMATQTSGSALSVTGRISFLRIL